jgi:hypothetical protein
MAYCCRLSEFGWDFGGVDVSGTVCFCSTWQLMTTLSNVPLPTGVMRGDEVGLLRPKCVSLRVLDMSGGGRPPLKLFRAIVYWQTAL